jgi:hypothetical protein
MDGATKGAIMSGEELLITNIAWLRDKAAGMSFGEAGIKVIIHEGEIKRIERTVTEKVQQN